VPGWRRPGCWSSSAEGDTPVDAARDISDLKTLAGLADEQLAAQAAREGSDGAAFTALMERYREKVWRVCWRLMGSEHDAEDAAQEVFVRLFFEREKFAGRSTYSTWLHGVAIRTCLMLRRSRSRRRRREDSGSEGRIEAEADAKPQGTAAVDATHDIRTLLEGLDEEDRALVLMRFAENHDYEQLAEMFGTSAGACRMRISRIREKLAAKAGGLFGGDRDTKG
jgi:RNA polymerase sigma-70 factor (ECF subfamily)